jgi:hypothetical protein
LTIWVKWKQAPKDSTRGVAGHRCVVASWCCVGPALRSRAYSALGVVTGRNWSSAVRAHGGCLGADRRRRTWQAAISCGEEHASCDPQISEWGNPASVMTRHSFRGEPTQGTETSKYLQEKKSNEIPQVAASERGRAQTEVFRGFGVVGPMRGLPASTHV